MRQYVCRAIREAIPESRGHSVWLQYLAHFRILLPGDTIAPVPPHIDYGFGHGLLGLESACQRKKNGNWHGPIRLMKPAVEWCEVVGGEINRPSRRARKIVRSRAMLRGISEFVG